MSANTDAQSISMFQPAARFAFDGARQGWERMIGEGLADVLASVT